MSKSTKCIICTGNVVKSSHKGKNTSYDSSYSLCYAHYTETREFIDTYLCNKDKTSAWGMALSIIRDSFLASNKS